MASIFAKISAKASAAFRPGTRPPAAVEVTPEGVLAAATSHSGQPVFAFVPLAADALALGLEEPNLHTPNAVIKAIGSALDQVSPRSHAVTLVLPNTLVRVFILDFDSLPAKKADALSVLRFRMRKMVSFDVEHAGVSYQILSQSETECRVLTAIMPGAILAEYEGAVRAAGYEPGVVLPSSLATLEVMDSMEAVMAVHLSRHTLATTITSGQDLLLYRSLDLPQDPAQRLEEIQRDIAVTAAYFEDKLRVRAQRLYYAGNVKREEFAGWINNSEVEVVDLVPRPESGLATSLGDASVAGVAGALALHVEAVAL